jgi:hypothetical protein
MPIAAFQGCRGSCSVYVDHGEERIISGSPAPGAETPAVIM